MGPYTPGREQNNLSAFTFSEGISNSISKELVRGFTLGPFSSPPFSNFHCSPLGAAPKKDGSIRIILDLSSPHGSSVNDGIPPEFFSVKYSSFDDAVHLVRSLGPNCFMAKIDIKHAFRICPVHPDDWPLLGFKWRGKYFFDVRLPFGSRSSPFIFNIFADALAWILIHKFGIHCLIHYLDDFFLCASSFHECLRMVNVVLNVFRFLGVPVAEDKLEGPSQRIVFLGIQIDSASFSISLPNDKLSDLSVALRAWQNKKKCRKVELLSLIGSLSFACKVVKPGRIFLRRLIDLSTSVDKLQHHIDLNASARSDLAMWSVLLLSWNGVSVIQSTQASSEELCLFTDASFKGMGGFFNGSWFSEAWPSNVEGFSIAFLELFAVLASIFVWGHRLRNHQIVVFSDNEAIVQVWKSGSSRDKPIMRLIRALFFKSVEFNISIELKHVPGSSNKLADLLSRLQVSRFREECHGAEDLPTVIPTSIWDLFSRE